MYIMPNASIFTFQDTYLDSYIWIFIDVFFYKSQILFPPEFK